jgi:hypothetical protein
MHGTAAGKPSRQMVAGIMKSGLISVDGSLPALGGLRQQVAIARCDDAPDWWCWNERRWI